MEKKPDRRAKYTRMMLRQSLIALMETQPVNKISVKALCERADVNRGTFYTHYRDPETLLQSMENELYDGIMASLEKHGKQIATMALVLEVLSCVSANIDLCRVLFSPYGDDAFLKRVMYVAHDASIRSWRAALPDADPNTLEYAYAFIANGSLGVLRHWVAQKEPEPPQTIARVIEQLAAEGTSGFLGNRKEK